eukprot:4608574-Alexandrium_andersonii.AAC.1
MRACVCNGGPRAHACHPMTAHALECTPGSACERCCASVQSHKLVHEAPVHECAGLKDVQVHSCMRAPR